ncbi:MAG: RHS repeat protein, partial [Candidatus Eremiobacteraeota bacterium]|nr:RHS repeat protein [Candidatus Eremiobacteraeota bacterium]
SGDLQTWTGLYGNGWTNTFDAHVIRTSPGHFSVYDIDGARYDFVPSGTPGLVIGPPGQPTTLQWDGACGLLWQKKSGTLYYFYDVNPAKPCYTGSGTLGGYAGRIHQIIGRNRNTSITFNYSWDNGDASASGKISGITATTESGMTATLSFADVNGHRLLQQIMFPDGVTTVSYGYDGNGNLTSISRPPNNAAGIRPGQSFGYVALGTGFVMQTAGSPRVNAACGTSSGCYSDGGGFVFGFTGSTVATSALSTIQDWGNVNPTIADGTTAAPMQGTAYSNSVYAYNTEYYTTGVTTPTFRDTAGHMTNWVVDGLGRPTQTQECTASTSQGQTCTGTWLLSNETWDTNNNRIADIDPRGYETDYGYDAMGNTVAVGEPQTATSQGTFRPTKLFDYDAYNNVTAYCDETETHNAGVVWSGSLSGSDSLCSTNDSSGQHWRASYTFPSYQPYGELATMSTPLGYTRHFSYSTAYQGGTDFGLPTSVTGDSFVQVDGSSLTPAQTFWYDATGNVRCSSNGQGISVLSYDALGRLSSAADPDDSSANAGSTCGKAAGQSGWNTQTTYTYFPDGSKQTSQSAVERANGVATGYTYDLDGNETSETHHFGCVAAHTCTPGVTTKWYDGADRLVEVEQPQDPSDYYPYPWLTRYLYDLTQNGNVWIAGTSFPAHGSLFKTQEWLTGPGASSPSWTDLHGNAFDALDRAVAKYTFSPSANTTLSTATTLYDGSSATLGLATSQTDPLGQTTTFSYDELGRTVGLGFTGDGGVTPAKAFTYDPNGRQVTASGAVYGTQTTSYDADGRVREVDESTNGSVSSPARLTYDYYPNGDRKDVNIASSALTAAPLLTYARRIDGALTKETLNYNGATSAFTWTYTDGGRKLTQNDPYTGTAMPSPQSPVNPGTLYAPTTWSYDTSGQMAGTGLPETLNYSRTSDFEGYLASSPATVTGSSSFAGGVSFYNTSRGENFQQVTNPWPSTANGFSTRPANGALVPALKNRGPAPSWGSAPAFDPINAVVLGGTLNGTAVDQINGTYPQCGPLPTIDTYDAASRLVSRPFNSMNPDSNGNCNIENDPGSYTWSYDAENHTISQLQGTAQWGPNGQPYHIGGSGISDSLHYDGGTLLFFTDGQGNLSGIRLGALADVAANGQITVWDRDTSNMRITGHNNTLYYGVSFGGRKFGPYRTGEGPGSLVSGASPIIFNGSTTAPVCTMQSCAIGGRYDYSRTEGFDWGNLTIQGARAVDNATGQWTTPDAYAGDVHDPMSQKPFMWDRNNPYNYSDPSGYTYTETAYVNGEALLLTPCTVTSPNSTAEASGRVGQTEHDVGDAILAAVYKLTNDGHDSSQLTLPNLVATISADLTGKGYEVTESYTKSGGAVLKIRDGTLVGGNPTGGYVKLGISADGMKMDMHVYDARNENLLFGATFEWRSSSGRLSGALFWRDMKWSTLWNWRVFNGFGAPQVGPGVD